MENNFFFVPSKQNRSTNLGSYGLSLRSWRELTSCWRKYKRHNSEQHGTSSRLQSRESIAVSVELPTTNQCWWGGGGERKNSTTVERPKLKGMEFQCVVFPFLQSLSLSLTARSLPSRTLPSQNKTCVHYHSTACTLLTSPTTHHVVQSGQWKN